MTERERLRFLEQMVLAVRQAGKVVQHLQSNIKNIEKEVDEVLEGESNRDTTMRRALTYADELSQEILIMAAGDVLDTRSVLLDAEEDTPSTKLFPCLLSDTTLVIDPIDGTLDYIDGADSYSVCVGLRHKGRIVSALVFFPRKDMLYFLDPYGRAHVATKVYEFGIKKAHVLKPAPLVHTKRLYRNGRVPACVIQCLTKNGYEVIEAIGTRRGWPYAFLECMQGKACAFIAKTPHPRDILLGAILQGVPGGYGLDWEGNRLVWPQKGRCIETLFGIGIPPKSLLACLGC